MKHEAHINGGNPEHNCPETGWPAWCYHKTCDLQVCRDAVRRKKKVRARQKQCARCGAYHDEVIHSPASNLPK